MSIKSDPFWDGIFNLHAQRTAPIRGKSDFGLPNENVNFETAKATIVAPSRDFTFASFAPLPLETNRKLSNLSSEFAGQPELLLLHAYLIAHSRKHRRPKLAQKLFMRLWREESSYLMSMLSSRWLLSSIISFGVYGENEHQRTAATAFNMFFSMMKLYEFERLFSGSHPQTLFRASGRKQADLPVGLQSYSLANGDLDTSTLALLGEISSRDAMIAVPCHVLLKQLSSEDGHVFARLNSMKEMRAAKAQVETAPTPKKWA